TAAKARVRQAPDALCALWLVGRQSVRGLHRCRRLAHGRLRSRASQWRTTSRKRLEISAAQRPPAAAGSRRQTTLRATSRQASDCAETRPTRVDKTCANTEIGAPQSAAPHAAH